jgi:hypothetical protein
LPDNRTNNPARRGDPVGRPGISPSLKLSHQQTLSVVFFDEFEDFPEINK